MKRDFPYSFGPLTIYSWGFDIRLGTNKQWRDNSILGWFTVVYRPLHVYFSPDATPCHPKRITFLRGWRRVDR